MQGYLRYGRRTAAPSIGGIRRPQGRAYTTKCAKAHEVWRGWKKSHRRERRSWRKPLSTTPHGGRSGSRTKPPTAGPTGILDAALTPWNDPVDNFGTVNSPPHGGAGTQEKRAGKSTAHGGEAARGGGRDERGAGNAGAGAEQPSRREPPAPHATKTPRRRTTDRRRATRRERPRRAARGAADATEQGERGGREGAGRGPGRERNAPPPGIQKRGGTAAPKGRRDDATKAV